MTRVTAVGVLAVAAALEAGGDALMRVGLHSGSLRLRLGLFAVAAVVLFGYGYVVNAPPWDFGKLLGLYVTFFFLFAQGISWVFFKQPPSLSVMIGGVLIVAGGAVIAANA